MIDATYVLRLENKGERYMEIKILYPNTKNYSIVQIGLHSPGVSTKVAAKAKEYLERLQQHPLRSRSGGKIRHLREYYTYSEELFKQTLKRYKLSKIHQYPVDGKIIDFKLVDYPILIELDGKNYHEEGLDINRDIYLGSLGYYVIRIPSKAVLIDPNAVVKFVIGFLRDLGHVDILVPKSKKAKGKERIRSIKAQILEEYRKYDSEKEFYSAMISQRKFCKDHLDQFLTELYSN
jgi:very-short-patch-repair endonuclease